MIKERRKHPRLRIPLEAEYLVASGGEWREGTIWTLGAGGAALLCEERLKRGTVLQGLHFVVAAEGDLPETRIEVGAQVVSVDRKGDLGRPCSYMLGLRFMDLDKQEFELLRQFVFRRLTGARHSPPEADSESATASASPIEIRFRLFDEFVAEVSENLSASGMFIRARRPLLPGSRFVFQFQLGDDFALFQGTAEVIWTRRRSEDPQRPPGMGVRFLKLDLTSQKLVRRLVGQRLTGGSADSPDAAASQGPAAARRTVLKLPEDPEPFAMQSEVLASSGGGPGADGAEAAADPKESKASGWRASLGTKRLEKRLGKAEAARDKAQEHLEQLSDEADSLREQIAALESAHEEAKTARTRAEAEATKLRGELQAHEPRGDLEEELQQAQQELERRQELWERKEAEFRAQLERLTLPGEEADSLRQKAAALESSRYEAESERASAEAEVARLREELEVLEPQRDLAEELRRSRKELEHRQAEWDRKELELREQLERRSASETELQERVERAGETEAELLQRLEQADGSQKELERLLGQGAETENELERLRCESEEARQEWQTAEAELQARLEERCTSEAALEERLDQAGAAEAQLRQRLEDSEARQAEMEGQLERAEGAESQLEQVRSEAEEAAQEWRATEAALRAQIEQGRTNEADLEKRLVEAVSLKTELRQQLDVLAQARGELEQRLEQRTAVELELREQAHELRVVREGLEKRLSHAADKMGGIRRLAEEMRSRLNGDVSSKQVLEMDFTATLDEFARARSGLDERVDALAAAHGSLGKRLERVTEAWSGLETGVAQITLEAIYNDELPAPDTGVTEEAEPTAQLGLSEESAGAATGAPAAVEPPPANEPRAEPVEARAPPAEAREPVPREPEIEADFTETVAEAPAPAPTSAARLVDVARRAVARLGFSRISAANGNGGDPEPDPRLVLADEMESATQSGAPGPLGIEETVRAWAAAWSEQRVEDYLSYYSRDFAAQQRPEEDDSGDATHAWLPPVAGMEATLGPISQVELAAGRYAVQFEQRVETDSYTRRTGRTLEMVREADAWKIAAESFQDL